MKKARAARDRAAPIRRRCRRRSRSSTSWTLSRPPDAPTVEAAWWISHQVSEHVFATDRARRSAHWRPSPETSHGDPSRRSQARPRRDRRPFPRDGLLGAAEFSADSTGALARPASPSNRQGPRAAPVPSASRGRHPIDGVACPTARKEHPREALGPHPCAGREARPVRQTRPRTGSSGRSPSFSFGAPAPGWTTETPTTGRPRM
jgi:hypothetical protein